MARTRYRADVDRIKLSDLPAGAMRAVWREGYTRADLRADVLAGLVVGIVALPLAMALAIAVGVAPQYGLYTSIVAGAVVAALGGSRLQVTGPTAAFIVILAPIYSRFGMSGLLLSGADGRLDADRHGARPARSVHRVHPAPGHHRLHRRDRHRHRHAAGQGRPRPQPVARARELLRSHRPHVAGARLGVARRAGHRSGHAGAPPRRSAPDQADSGAAGGHPAGRRAGRHPQPRVARPRGRHHRQPLSRHGRRPRLQRRSPVSAAADAPLGRARAGRRRAPSLADDAARAALRAPSPWRCWAESSRCSPR